MKFIHPLLLLLIFSGCGNDRTNNNTDNDLATYNLKTAVQTGINILHEAPYNLSGKNQKVAVVDGGKVLDTHKSFLEDNGTSRVILKTEDSTISNHATHVAGTIGANSFDLEAKGMAPRSTIYSFYFNDVGFGNSIKKAFENNIYISNHSYGVSEKKYLGEYGYWANDLDKTIHANNTLIACFAAGNDGEDPEYDEYQIIKGPTNAKNILTIGALNDEGDALAPFSSTGPVFDGRIKPDFSIRGSLVYSAGSAGNDIYAYMQGTSMATPATTGTIALLSEYYQKIVDDENAHIRFDQIKSILMNSSSDLGNIGPDYKYGYGKINAKKAADIITTIEGDEPLLFSSKIGQDGFEKYSINITEDTIFRASIAWTDLAAPTTSTKTLMNDIDMWISDEDRNIIYPYTLDKDNPSVAATQDKKNHVDNGEMIESNLSTGKYYLYIKGENIQNFQDFTLTTSTPVTLDKKEEIEIELNEFMNIILENQS